MSSFSRSRIRRAVAATAAAVVVGGGSYAVASGTASAADAVTYRVILTGTVTVTDYDWIGQDPPCEYQLNGYHDITVTDADVDIDWAWGTPLCDNEVTTMPGITATMHPDGTLTGTFGGLVFGDCICADIDIHRVPLEVGFGEAGRSTDIDFGWENDDIKVRWQPDVMVVDADTL